MKNSNVINILINHSSRSKAGMTEEFSSKKYGTLTLGRSTSCDIAFDPDADNMVSRHHATIKALNDGTHRYQIIDENSLNGVYVNGQRIKGMAVLVPTDRIQLGKGGPEFTFDLTPRPDSLLGKTRVMAAPVKATQIKETPTVATSAPTSRPTINSAALQKVGAVAAGIFLTILFMTSISWVEKPDEPTVVEPRVVDTFQRAPEAPVVIEPAPVMSPAEVASAYQDAVVYISNSWKLENYEGKQIYHRYTAIEVEGEIYAYPCYIRNDKGMYEPYLETFNYEGYSKVIAGSGSGSGFVVSEDGFIMTNKHVSSPWNYPYAFDENAFPGLEVNVNGDLLVTAEETFQTVNKQDVGSWIPAEAYIGSLPDHKLFEGQMIYQDVVFANRTGRHSARTARTSDKHDVALLKVDVGTSLKTVEMHDDYSDVSNGSEVTILGYPALTPKKEKVETAYGPATTSKLRVVPNPTINRGIITALHKGSTSFDLENFSRNYIGDAYQLDINSAGRGNSGGPMFDSQGRVTGIYFYGVTDYSNTISFAIPIKYGIELLGL